LRKFVDGSSGTGEHRSADGQGVSFFRIGTPAAQVPLSGAPGAATIHAAVDRVWTPNKADRGPKRAN
jgi:hypothetical protein